MLILTCRWLLLSCTFQGIDFLAFWLRNLFGGIRLKAIRFLLMILALDVWLLTLFVLSKLAEVLVGFLWQLGGVRLVHYCLFVAWSGCLRTVCVKLLFDSWALWQIFTGIRLIADLKLASVIRLWHSNFAPFLATCYLLRAIWQFWYLTSLLRLCEYLLRGLVHLGVRCLFALRECAFT